MTHYDLLDSTQMSEAESALMLARLHLRGGKRQMEEGLTTSGVAALYDALLFGMRYYLAWPEHRKTIDLTNNEDLWDPVALYHTLTNAGVFDDPYAFNHLSLVVERALWQESFLFDARPVLVEVEAMLTRLGVMPFDQVALISEALVAH